MTTPCRPGLEDVDLDQGRRRRDGLCPPDRRRSRVQLRERRAGGEELVPSMSTFAAQIPRRDYGHDGPPAGCSSRTSDRRLLSGDDIERARKRRRRPDAHRRSARLDVEARG
jgi:hypothetical protein